MFPVEDVRLLAAEVLVAARWHFPEPPCCGPFPALLLLADWPSAEPGLPAAEVTNALVRRGFAVLQVRESSVPEASLPTLLQALRQHHLASKVRLGAVLFGAPARRLPPLRDFAPFLRAELRPGIDADTGRFVPEVSSPLRTAAEWSAARAIAEHLHGVLVPAWEMQARRPGTAIG